MTSFVVQDVSFVSRTHGFALGAAQCGHTDCTVVLESLDAARHWTAVSRVSAPLGSDVDCKQATCVRSLRFVTPKIGYAFGPSLLLTVDGGRSWRPVPGPPVAALEGDSRSVLRVTSPQDGCSGRRSRLETSLPGSTRWYLVQRIPSNQICPPSLYRQGRDGVVLVTYGNPAGCCPNATLYTSSDRGRHLATRADPCRHSNGDGFAASVALAPAGVLAVLCEGRTSPASVQVSTDLGRTFGLRRPVGHGEPPCGLAAASAVRLLAVTACGPHVTALEATQDGGRTWGDGDEYGPGVFVLVGFQDPLTARTAQGAEIHTTFDGGRTWRDDLFGS